MDRMSSLRLLTGPHMSRLVTKDLKESERSAPEMLRTNDVNH